MRSKSKYFSLDRLQYYNIEVPCGECCECQAARSNEYTVRSYYQYLDCVSKGGYVYFFTLTYDDEHLPHLYDFQDDLDLPFKLPFDKDGNGVFDYSCFNYRDIRLFIVNLRRQLEYHGFDVKGKLKYFICSEYGHEDEYVDEHGNLRKGTRRPHYHGLIYVYEPGKLSPFELAGYIDKLWDKGRTDGPAYRERSYVLDHIFMGSDELHARAVSHYVGKYMVKDYDWMNGLRKRFDDICDYIRKVQFEELWRYYGVNKCLEGDLMSEQCMQEIEEPLWNICWCHKTSFGKRFDEMFKICQSYFPDMDEEMLKKSLRDFLLMEKELWSEKRAILKRHIMPFTRQSQGYGLYMIDYLTPDWIFKNNCVEMPDKDCIKKQMPIPGYIVNKLFKEQKVDEFGNVYMDWSEYGIEFRKFHSVESMKRQCDKVEEVFNYYNLVQQCQYTNEQANDIVKRYKALLSDFGRQPDRTVQDFCEYLKYWKGRLFNFDLFVDEETGEIPNVGDIAYETVWTLYMKDKHVDDIDVTDVFHVEDDYDISCYVEHYIIDQESDSRFSSFDALYSMYKKIHKRLALKRQELWIHERDQRKRYENNGWYVKNKY